MHLPAKEITVLVVDDEAAVRRFVRAILLRQGYRVLEAVDGQAAYELIHHLSGGIQLLITDVQMPRMDGIALGGTINKDFPKIEVLYISGFISNPNLPTDSSPNHHFLAKPFAVEALTQYAQRLCA